MTIVRIGIKSVLKSVLPSLLNTTTNPPAAVDFRLQFTLTWISGGKKTSVFLVPISLGHTQQKTDQVHVEDLLQRIQTVPNRPQKASS